MTRSKLYDRKSWRRRARLQLIVEPLCSTCEQKGLITPAVHADHVIAHKGNEKLFWEGALQSLCAECHSQKSALENGKRIKAEIDIDGWPSDRK